MNLSDPIQFLIFLTGAILSVKKLSEMERYQSLRVFVLTAMLSYIVLYFIAVNCFPYDYLIESDPAVDHFTLTEM